MFVGDLVLQNSAVVTVQVQRWKICFTSSLVCFSGSLCCVLGCAVLSFASMHELVLWRRVVPGLRLHREHCLVCAGVRLHVIPNGDKVSYICCVQDVQSEYDTYKKGKAREITDLKKDSQRQESKMRRLAMLNQKQKSVLQACLPTVCPEPPQLLYICHRAAPSYSP